MTQFAVEFRQHFPVIQTEHVFIPELEILFYVCAKTATLAIMWRLRDSQYNRLHMIQRYFDSTLMVFFLNAEMFVGLYETRSKPRKLGPPICDPVTTMILKSVKELMTFAFPRLTKVDQSVVFIIKCIQAHLVTKIYGFRFLCAGSTTF